MSTRNAVKAAKLCGMLILILLTTSLSAYSDNDYKTTPQVHFERISLRELELEGDTVGSIGSIAQDKLGFLWFGGENGLVRYDGHGFTLFQSDKSNPFSISSNQIMDLLVDLDGVLWVATDKGLNRYDHQLNRFERFSSSAQDPKRILNDFIPDLELAPDNQLYIATGDGLSIFSADRSKITHFKPDPSHIAPPNTRVSALEITSDYKVYIGFFLRGVYEYDPQNPSIKQLPLSKALHEQLYEKRLVNTDIMFDSQKRLWITSINAPLMRINADGSTVSFDHLINPRDVNVNLSFGIQEDSQGQIWLYTDQTGIGLFDEQNQVFHPVQFDPYDSNTISSNQVRSLFEDSRGGIWAGTFTSGINLYDPNQAQFTKIYRNPSHSTTLSHNAILSLFQSSDGEIWIGTEKGLNHFNPVTGHYKNYTAESTGGQLRSDTVLSIIEVPNGNLWIGTTRGGIYVFDRSKDTFTALNKETMRFSTEGDNYVWKLLYTGDSVWAGTFFGGFVQYDLQGKKVHQYRVENAADEALLGNYVSHFVLDNQGNFWIATLEGLSIVNPQTHKTEHLFHQGLTDTKTSSYRITALLRDRNDQIWVAIHGFGIHIYDTKRNIVRSFTVADGLNSALINGLIEDNQGIIWAATHNGISRIDPESGTITNLQKQHGIVANNHNRDATLLTDDGLLYFGSSDGITRFNPKIFSIPSNTAPVQLTKLIVNAKPVEVNESSNILEQSLFSTETIHLKHKHTSLAFEYALLNYPGSVYNSYSVRLEPFDKQWGTPSRSHIANYTNIPPGDYVFKIRGFDMYGQPSETLSKINVVITPAPWLTWWAYSLYSIAGVTFLILMIQKKRKELELEKEKALNKELVNLGKLKNTFLANTSHELRTPLNGIIGISQSLKEHCQRLPDNDLDNQLNIILFSSKKLLNLINDVLDFAKLESDNVALNMKPINPNAVIREALVVASAGVDNSQLTISSDLLEPAPVISADPTRLQQVLYNLIENAIKHTEKGYIKISSQIRDQYLDISVKDTGKGIPEKELPMLFGVFNQSASEYGNEKGGMGLGLAIAKQIIELHEGRISVLTRPNEGATFIISLPIPAEQECIVERESQNAPAIQVATPFKRIEGQSKGQGQRILIVDDDAVNRLVLVNFLQSEFDVIEAEDGEAAVNIIQEDPSIALVLMDIMMPKLNGFESCKEIRKTRNKFELPIIFVTARNVEEDTRYGFEIGGNDFIEKPVAKAKLIPRIQHALRLNENRVASNH